MIINLNESERINIKLMLAEDYKWLKKDIAMITEESHINLFGWEAFKKSRTVTLYKNNKGNYITFDNKRFYVNEAIIEYKERKNYIKSLK